MHLGHETDLVIGVGASLNRHTLENGYMYPEARYVHIDSQPHLMMGGGRAADCYLQSDARIGVEELEKLLASRGVKLAGYRTPDVKAQLVNHNADRTEFEMDPGTVDPREAVIALDQIVPPEIGVLSGSGMTSAFCSMLMTRRRGLVQGGHFFGCIGQMLPAAMGAVVATGKPAMLIDGDASVMMHLAEFETAVRYNMPLFVVVMNNEALGAEYYKLDAHGMETRGSQITTPDLGKVAVSFGGRGRMATTIDELSSAAKEFVTKPGPMMVDLRISKSVPSVPYRRLHYGRDE
jgi:thiamine pyrophosphate-dependent acetolactate synthase large subunit-like protein